MGKILLFYKYLKIQYPKQIQKWQLKLCQELDLKGRIIIAQEGINGTVGGTEDNIEIYKKVVQTNPLFEGIDFKESPGNSECFPRLRIVIRKEIVTLGVDPSAVSWENAGKHLTIEETHNLISNKPNDLVILDVRNKYESDIGHFENAIFSNTRFFREFPNFIDSNLETFKDKKVLMYCTGGIRCERASSYLKSKKITKEVYQIEGGIHKYIEKYPDGFFKGRNYVFDGRIALQVNDEVIGSCYICKTQCDGYTNCLNAVCNRHFICCKNCMHTSKNTCSENCYNLINEKRVKVRPQLKKVEIESCCM